MTIYWPGEGEYLPIENEDGSEVVGFYAEPHLIVKWMLDGAKTLSEAAAELRLIADHYEAAERDGWRLIEPIRDGCGALGRADSAPS